MAPMWWTTLMVMITCLSIMTNSMLYFNSTETKKKKPKQEKTLMNWKR